MFHNFNFCQKEIKFFYQKKKLQVFKDHNSSTYKLLTKIQIRVLSKSNFPLRYWARQWNLIIRVSRLHILLIRKTKDVSVMVKKNIKRMRSYLEITKIWSKYALLGSHIISEKCEILFIYSIWKEKKKKIWNRDGMFQKHFFLDQKISFDPNGFKQQR